MKFHFKSFKPLQLVQTAREFLQAKADQRLFEALDRRMEAQRHMIQSELDYQVELQALEDCLEEKLTEMAKKRAGRCSAPDTSRHAHGISASISKYNGVSGSEDEILTPDGERFSFGNKDKEKS